MSSDTFLNEFYFYLLLISFEVMLTKTEKKFVLNKAENEFQCRPRVKVSKDKKDRN